MNFQKIMLFCVTAFFLSCGEKKPEPKKSDITSIVNEYPDSDMVSKYYFKNGTYWVFKNQNGSMDSVIVVGQGEGPVSSSCCTGTVLYRIHSYCMYQKSITNNTSFQFNFFGTAINYKAGAPSTMYAGQDIYVHNGVINNQDGCGMTITNYFDSLVVQGKMYYGVVKTHIDKNLQCEPQLTYDTFFYFAPGKGVIKKEINDTINGLQTWELKNCFIVK